jgi:hypothetical protein
MGRSVTAVVLVASLGAIVGQAGCRQSTQVGADRFPALYAQALCTSLQHCCAENGVTQDYALCTKGWEAAVTALVNTTGNYDQAAASQCIAEVSAAQDQSCQPVPGSLSDARTTCQAIFVGTVPLGAPCTSATQCAPQEGSQVVCAVQPGAGGGDDGGGGGGSGGLPLSDPSVSIRGVTLSPQAVPVCVAVTPADAVAPAPGPCTSDADAGTDSCISQGKYCDSSSHQCTDFAPTGQPCDPAVAASCQAGNYCDGTGTCVTSGPVGSPCTAAAMCDATGYCDTGSHTCTATLQPGAHCSSGAQCSIGVCDSTTHTCLTNAIATSAACNGIVSPQ